MKGFTVVSYLAVTCSFSQNTKETFKFIKTQTVDHNSSLRCDYDISDDTNSTIYFSDSSDNSSGDEIIYFNNNGSVIEQSSDLNSNSSNAFINDLENSERGDTQHINKRNKATNVSVDDLRIDFKSDLSTTNNTLNNNNLIISHSIPIESNLPVVARCPRVEPINNTYLPGPERDDSSNIITVAQDYYDCATYTAGTTSTICDEDSKQSVLLYKSNYLSSNTYSLVGDVEAEVSCDDLFNKPNTDAIINAINNNIITNTIVNELNLNDANNTGSKINDETSTYGELENIESDSRGMVTGGVASKCDNGPACAVSTAAKNLNFYLNQSDSDRLFIFDKEIVKKELGTDVKVSCSRILGKENKKAWF